MKKILVLPVLLSLLVFSCTKTDQSSLPKNATLDLEQAAPSNLAGGGPGRGCATNEVHSRNLLENPGLAKKMNDIEAFTKKIISDPTTYKILPDAVLEIPVIVNVLWRTNSENITLDQINSQINALNADFTATNSDIDLINPTVFYGKESRNTMIKFVLGSVKRKSTKKTSWGTNDAMKKTKQGGIDPTSPSTTLNMWVCAIGGGILGYAQFPGGSASTDGVVIDYRYFGTKGTATALFNLGRTATHEVGHYFNLRHIWGDATCGNDLVDDTPTHNTANYGDPSYPQYSTCSGTPIEMTMNYMDYTDDRGMYMFSNGQASRMQATFAVGGPRASLR